MQIHITNRYMYMYVQKHAITKWVGCLGAQPWELGRWVKDFLWLTNSPPTPKHMYIHACTVYIQVYTQCTLGLQHVLTEGIRPPSDAFLRGIMRQTSWATFALRWGFRMYWGLLRKRERGRKREWEREDERERVGERERGKEEERERGREGERERRRGREGEGERERGRGGGRGSGFGWDKGAMGKWFLDCSTELTPWTQWQRW